MPQDLQRKAEDLLTQLPSRAAISKRLSQKRACFNFTFFCGIDELPNVQVLCCVKELLEQFVPELEPEGKRVTTCSCILSYFIPSPMVASCVSTSPAFSL